MKKMIFLALLMGAALVNSSSANNDTWWIGIHSGFKYDNIRLNRTFTSFGSPIAWEQVKPGKSVEFETFISRNINEYFSLKTGVNYSRKASFIEASEHIEYTSIYNLYNFEFKYEFIGIALQAEGVLLPNKAVSPFFVTGVKCQWKLSESYFQINNDNTETEIELFNSTHNNKNYWTVPAEAGIQFRYNAQLGIKLSAVYEQYWQTPVFLISNMVSIGALFKLNYYFGNPQPPIIEEDILKVE